MVSYDELIMNLEKRRTQLVARLGKDHASHDMTRGALHLLDSLIDEYEEKMLSEEEY